MHYLLNRTRYYLLHISIKVRNNLFQYNNTYYSAKLSTQHIAFMFLATQGIKLGVDYYNLRKSCQHNAKLHERMHTKVPNFESLSSRKKIFKRPLEQFEVDIFAYLNKVEFLDLTILNVYLAIGCLLILSCLFLSLRKALIIPKRWQSLTELSIVGLTDLVVQQAGKESKKYVSLYYSLFFFILGLNVVGLLPLGFTVTSHILITLGLSFSLNVGLLIIGFTRFGLSFLKLFVPSDAPKPLLPLVVLIEIVSYIIRPFSLAIRLFANMMAGHSLLFILAGFVLAFLTSPFYLLAILPFSVVLAVLCLEVGISFLQAYVFTVLLAIYMNDSLNLH